MNTFVFAAVSALSFALSPVALGADAKVDGKANVKKADAMSCTCSAKCMKDCKAGKGKNCKCEACDCATSKMCDKEGCAKHQHGDGKACDSADGKGCMQHQEGEAHEHGEGHEHVEGDGHAH